MRGFMMIHASFRHRNGPETAENAVYVRLEVVQEHDGGEEQREAEDLRAIGAARILRGEPTATCRLGLC